MCSFVRARTQILLGIASLLEFLTETVVPARTIAVFCCPTPTKPTLPALYSFLYDMFALCQCVSPSNPKPTPPRPRARDAAVRGRGRRPVPPPSRASVVPRGVGCVVARVQLRRYDS